MAGSTCATDRHGPPPCHRWATAFIGLPAAGRSSSPPERCFERQGVAILRLVAPGNPGEALTTAEAFGGRRAVEGDSLAPNDFLGRAARARGPPGVGWGEALGPSARDLPPTTSVGSSIPAPEPCRSSVRRAAWGPSTRRARGCLCSTASGPTVLDPTVLGPIVLGPIVPRRTAVHGSGPQCPHAFTLRSRLGAPPDERCPSATLDPWDHPRVGQRMSTTRRAASNMGANPETPTRRCEPTPSRSAATVVMTGQGTARSTAQSARPIPDPARPRRAHRGEPPQPSAQTRLTRPSARGRPPGGSRRDARASEPRLGNAPRPRDTACGTCNRWAD